MIKLEYFAPLLTIFVVNLLGWLTPGPNMVAVIRAAMGGGRRSGLAVGMGLAAASTLWTLLALFGVTALFEIFPWIATAIKIAGASYLIWLGVSALRNSSDAASLDLTCPATQSSSYAGFLRGFIVSMTNPKAALFYGSILSAVVPPDSTHGFLFVVVLVCGGLAWIFPSITALVFSTKRAMQFFVDCKKYIERLFGMIFIGIGGMIFYDALRR